METPEIARLQNEIARLNNIIDALITENKVLKHQLAYHNTGESTQNVLLAYPKKEAGNLNVPDSQNNSGAGNLDIMLADHKKEVGNMNVPDSQPDSWVGNLKVQAPQSGSEVGNLNVPDAQPGSGEVNPNVPALQTDSREGNLEVQDMQSNSGESKKTVQPAQDKTGTPSTGNCYPLSGYLGKMFMKNSHYSGRNHAAKLLLYFYHEKQGDYHTLMKVSKLSYFGLGKMIGSMKKRGWLVRIGKQKFTLTPYGREVVEAGCGLK